MSKTCFLETPFDEEPTSASTYAIYSVDDQFIFGNGEDDTLKYDGENPDALEGGAPKGSILVVYKDRLMIAGDPGFPHRWWYSHIRNGEGWTPAFDWLDVYPEDGGVINGGVIQNDELIISKSNGRKYGWRIYDDGDPGNSLLRRIEDDKGNVIANSETILEDVNYYLDRNAVFTVPAGPKGGLSYVVQEVISGIQDFSDVAVGSEDGKLFVSLGDIMLDIEDGVSIQEAVLVYDSVTGTFHIRDRTAARSLTRYIDTDGDESAYFGSDNGRVFRLDDGETADNVPVNMLVRTKQYLRGLGKNVSVSRVGIYMRNPSGTRVSYRMSESTNRWETLGTVTQTPVHWFEPSDAVGPFIQLEFVHSGSVGLPEIEGIEIVYNEEGMYDG